jgi:hypothetical protein
MPNTRTPPSAFLQCSKKQIGGSLGLALKIWGQQDEANWQTKGGDNSNAGMQAQRVDEHVRIGFIFTRAGGSCVLS